MYILEYMIYNIFSWSFSRFDVVRRIAAFNIRCRKPDAFDDGVKFLSSCLNSYSHDNEQELSY